LTHISVGNVPVVQYLLEEVGIEPKDLFYNDSSNLVHAAVRFNQMDVLYALLTHRHGACRYLVFLGLPPCPDSLPPAPCHLPPATCPPHVPAPVHGLSNYVQVNMPDQDGNTPLHVLLTTDHSVDAKILLAKALIQAGAELRLQNNEKKTPVELIINEAEKEIILKELERDLTMDASQSQNCTIS
jgi:ankyrin repeat protein